MNGSRLIAAAAWLLLPAVLFGANIQYGGAGGGVAGTGTAAAGDVAFWTSAAQISGETAFSYDSATNTLDVDILTADRATLASDPAGTTVADGLIYLNPTTPSANETLIGAEGTTSDFLVDAEGDITTASHTVNTGAGQDAVVTEDGIDRANASAQTFTIQNSAGLMTLSSELMSLAPGTLTTDVNVLSMTPTWNNAGVTFEGMVMNVTDTASAAGSLFADFQASSDSKLSFAKDGTVTTQGDYMPEATATYEYTPTTFLMNPAPWEIYPSAAAVVVPADDRPIIFTLYSGYYFPVKAYRCNDSSCSGVGTTTSLGPNMMIAQSDGLIAAGIIPSSGIPFYVGIDANSDVIVGVCTTAACTAVYTNVIASGTYDKVSLAFRGSDDKAIITYVGGNTTYMLSCSDPGAATPCSTSSTPVALSEGSWAVGTSSAWVGGLPFLTYTANDFYRLVTVGCADDDCASYTLTKHANAYTQKVNAAVDPNDGFASITYVSSGSFVFASCGDAACTSLDQSGVTIDNYSPSYANGALASLRFYNGKPVLLTSFPSNGFVAKAHFCTSSFCTTWSSTSILTYGTYPYAYQNGVNAAISSTGDLWTVMASNSANSYPYLTKLPLANPSVAGTELGSDVKRISSAYIEAGVEAGSLTLRGATAPWDGVLYFEGATDDSYELALKAVDPTADRTITFPNASGTVALTSQLPANTVDSNGTCAAGYVPYMVDADTIGCEAAFSYNSSTNTLDVDILAADRATITGGSFSSGTQALNVTGAIPNSGGTSVQYGEKHVFSTTGSSSSADVPIGNWTEMQSGYTGPRDTMSIYAYSAVAGTGGASGLGMWCQTGNHGLRAASAGTTTGANYAVAGYAAGGAYSIGASGVAPEDKANAINVGVMGSARNDGSGGVNAGVVAVLMGAPPNESPPTIVDAALLVDNMTTTDPIAIFRDNGTAVLTIADNGAVTMTQSLSVGTVLNLAPQGSARGSSACDASGEEGDVYMRRVSTTVTCQCVCVQNGASYEWAAISLLGACVASTDC